MEAVNIFALELLERERGGGVGRTYISNIFAAACLQQMLKVLRLDNCKCTNKPTCRGLGACGQRPSPPISGFRTPGLSEFGGSEKLSVCAYHTNMKTDLCLFHVKRHHQTSSPVRKWRAGQLWQRGRAVVKGGVMIKCPVRHSCSPVQKTRHARTAGARATAELEF